MSQLRPKLDVSLIVANLNLLLPLLDHDPLQFSSLIMTPRWVHLEVPMLFIAFTYTYKHVVENDILLLKVFVEIDVDEVVIFPLVLDIALCSPCASRTKASVYFILYIR